MTICPRCGLPTEACICKELTKSKEKINVGKVKRRYGKIVTVISGIEENTKEIAKKLKAGLACGGTYKGSSIELQGNHIKKAKTYLIELGFSEENINVIL